MAKARNVVIAGDYEGKIIQALHRMEQEGRHKVQKFYPAIVLKVKFGQPEKWDQVRLDKSTVAGYELTGDSHGTSVASGLARGIVGGARFGGAGAVVGAMTAKKNDVYTLAITFTDGKRSLIEVDEKLYQMIVKACF